MSEPRNSTRRLGRRSIVAALIVAVVRGGNQVALKYALTSFAPLWSAFARMSVSAATVFALSRRGGDSLQIAPHERRPLLALGAIFTVQIGLLHWGADLTSPAYAVVLINTNPIFANLVSHFFVPEDRLSGLRGLGLAVAFLGVCGVFWGRPDPVLAPNPLLGNFMIVVSGAMVGVRTVYIQRIVQNMPSTRAVFWQMIISLPCFALAATLLGDSVSRLPLSFAPLAAVAYQGLIVGGLSLIVWVRLLKRHTPGAISVFSFITPMAGLVLTAIFFGEALTPRLVAGLAAVLTGIALVTRPNSPPRPPVQE